MQAAAFPLCCLFSAGQQKDRFATKMRCKDNIFEAKGAALSMFLFHCRAWDSIGCATATGGELQQWFRYDCFTPETRRASHRNQRCGACSEICPYLSA